jgi:hypothetical protein
VCHFLEKSVQDYSSDILPEIQTENNFTFLGQTFQLQFQLVEIKHEDPSLVRFQYEAKILGENNENETQIFNMPLPNAYKRKDLYLTLSDSVMNSIFARANEAGLFKWMWSQTDLAMLGSITSALNELCVLAKKCPPWATTSSFYTPQNVRLSAEAVSAPSMTSTQEYVKFEAEVKVTLEVEKGNH